MRAGHSREYLLNVKVLEIFLGRMDFKTSECRSEHFPAYFGAATPSGNQVEFADIGCGFGGLLIRLANVYPDL